MRYKDTTGLGESYRWTDDPNVFVAGRSSTCMTSFVGVDWGSNGWITAVRTTDGWSARLHPSIQSVWHHHHEAELILVDIPIGIPESGRRRCDEAAKNFLRGQQGRVFWTPPRPALHAPTYTTAKAKTEAHTDGSLTTQAWGFLPRIEEVDVFFAETPAARGTVRESHPEVCFAALGDGPITAAKTTEEGRNARLAVLDEYDDATAAYEQLIADHIDDPPTYGRRFRASNRDDILDAMCLALVGWLDEGEIRTLPQGTPPNDPERDVPMEIVYRAISA